MHSIQEMQQKNVLPYSKSSSKSRHKWLKEVEKKWKTACKALWTM